MYVRTLEIINARSFKREKVEFSKGINLLIGKNNSGKSTIIRSIYKLQEGHVLDKEDVRRGTNGCKIMIELVDLDKHDQHLFFDKNLHKGYASTDRQMV